MTDTTLYQHGTLAQLVPGLFTGTLSVGELLTHGDTGIGTLAGLDGELMILNGRVYQANAAGAIREVALTETVPFANVHNAAFGAPQPVSNQDKANLAKIMQTALRTANLFAAVRVIGTFAAITTRAVARQTPPYPTLVETAAHQSVFTGANVAGTLIGYYAPALYDGMAVPGFHLHFLADDHTIGGHVLDYTLANGMLAVQSFASLELHLPATDAAFRAQELAGESIRAAIQQAEN